MQVVPEHGMALGVLLLGSLIGIGLTVFWIWMLVDCIKNEPSTGNDKIVWVIVILLFHMLGSLLYLLIRRPQRIAQYGH